MSPTLSPVPRNMGSTKRQFISAGDYSPLVTKFGNVMVLPTDAAHANVEVRADDFLVDGVQFRFAMTVNLEPDLAPSLVGRLTEWGSGGSWTPRRKKMIMDEVLARVNEAYRGPMAPAFEEARRRVLSNDIRSLDEDVEEARKKLEELVAKRDALLAEESVLLSA